MKPHLRSLPWFLLAAALLCLAWFLPDILRVETKNPEPAENRRPVSSQRSKAALPGDDSPAGTPVDSSVPASAEVAKLIVRSMDRFLASTGEEESHAILEELRTGIRSADSQEAAAAIEDFLKTAKDAPTRLPFVVGPEGLLDLAPTLRTALLDLLGALDPILALEVSRRVMDEMKSPDEYALALRNLAWNDVDGDLRSELSGRLEQVLAFGDWVSKPSSGFLEALDASVEISSKQAFDSIVGVGVQAVGSSNSSLSRAAFVALDRMVLRNPGLLVDAFDADPALRGLPAEQRASLMSRLDVTDPKQRETLVHYLSTTTHGDGELDYFSRLFPNGNYLHGNWLITSGEPSHSIESRLAADKAVLGEIEKLAASPINQAGREALQRIRERMEKIVAEPTPGR